MEAATGSIDSPPERFLLRRDPLTPSEHLVAVRALDTGPAKAPMRLFNIRATEAKSKQGLRP
jgi:hypothetical protein